MYKSSNLSDLDHPFYEHPEHSLEEWMREVVEGDTRDSYKTWCQKRIETPIPF